MHQTVKGPEGNEEVCSTTEVQYAEKNGLVNLQIHSHISRRTLVTENIGKSAAEI